MTLWSVLLLANLALGIAVVYVKHSNQMLFKQVQQHREDHYRLQTDWGRLLLEEATLAAYAHVEKRAVQELQMRRPDAAQVRLLSP